MSKDNNQENISGYKSAEDKALERFADLMIDKINTLQHDWKQPWFSESSLSVPRNLSGRQYNGMNSVLLMLHCQKNNYPLPVFATFDRITGLNYTKQNDGSRVPSVDADGNKLPMVSINKGEKSFPVMITTFTVVEKDTREKIKYDDYKQLSDEEKANYNVFPKLNVYNVFNVDQTNLKEVRPELYAKLEDQTKGKRFQQDLSGEVMPAIDAMIKDNGWYCPIKEVHGNDAYYSISKDEIVLPERSQFKDLESFQSNLFHEAAHSTGSEDRLNRLKPSSFGSSDYAAEELKAELTAAFVSANYGMVKGLKEDSAPYLKSWLSSLNESPDFLKSILLDVKRASSMLTQRIDGINQRIEQGLSPVADEWKQAHEKTRVVTPQAEEIAAKSAPGISADDVKTKLDNFMQDYYFAARRDNDFRMQGFTEHEGKPALRITSDTSQGTSHYIVTHEQDDEQKDHFFMHLMDGGKEIFKSREMPQDRDAAYSFMRGAAKEQVDHDYEQRENQDEAVQKGADQSRFHR